MDKKFGKDFEVKMEKWAKEMEKDSEKFSKEYEVKMEAWSKDFEKDMEAWGEEFGKKMEAWGRIRKANGSTVCGKRSRNEGDGRGDDLQKNHSVKST